jgi:hypothetical protein
MPRLSTPWTARSVAFVFALGALAACDDEPTFPGDTSTTLTVLLTDAPGAVEAVWVEILEIYLQGGGEGGRVTLLDEPTGLIELTELVGSSRTLVADVELDPAAYGQLRMVLGDAVLETDAGDVYVLGDAEHPDGLPVTGELQCPSCQQSGLKVIIPNDEMDVEEGPSALVLDFDVAQSFGHKAGNSGKWVMKPTIMGTLIADENGDGVPDIDQIGSVSGTVALATGVTIPDCPAGSARDLTDFIPTASAQTLVDGDGAPIVRTGAVDEAGAFAMAFLSADDYTLGYQGELEFEDATLAFTAEVAPPEVTVADDAVTGVEYTITAAVCNVSGG